MQRQYVVNATYRQSELQSTQDSTCNTLLLNSWPLPRGGHSPLGTQALLSSPQQRPSCSSVYFYYATLSRRQSHFTTEALGFSGANINKQAHQTALHTALTFFMASSGNRTRSVHDALFLTISLPSLRNVARLEGFYWN